MLKRLIAILPGVVLAFAVSVAAAEGAQVAVSIKPIHSLIAAVMEGAGVPYLIVDGAASPHNYAFKPSDAKALNSAKLVFTVGGEMDGFLNKPLAALAGKARVVELVEVPFIRLRMSGKEHGKTGPDLHLWLDPRNARAIVATAVAELSVLDPANTNLYHTNGERLSRRLDKLDLELSLWLTPVAKVPFIVFHDAFQYLVKAYDLNQAGFVALSPEHPPGTRHFREIRHQMREIGVRCLFREPQFGSRLIATLAEGSEIKVGVLDPLGAALKPGPELYFNLMRSNAAALVRCLGEG